MTKGGFRDKPSKSHIIWTRETRGGVQKKRFDQSHFKKWTNHCGFDFETSRRVDHERAEEPRDQYRCVFKWGQTSGEEIEFGDEEWELGNQKTPRTFVEIDTKGVARVKGWQFETVLDIAEMRHKGPELLIKTRDGSKKRLNGRRFVQKPRDQQRKDG